MREYAEVSLRKPSVHVCDECNPEQPSQTEKVDYNAGILMPIMDADNCVVFRFGGGGQGAKYY